MARIMAGGDQLTTPWAVAARCGRVLVVECRRQPGVTTFLGHVGRAEMRGALDRILPQSAASRRRPVARQALRSHACRRGGRAGKNSAPPWEKGAVLARVPPRPGGRPRGPEGGGANSTRRAGRPCRCRWRRPALVAGERRGPLPGFEDAGGLTAAWRLRSGDVPVKRRKALHVPQAAGRPKAAHPWA